MASTTPKRIAQGSKPKKPYPEFPLTAHPSGQWSKKIRQKVHYFGVWADPDAALNLYLDQRDDLQAGRIPDKGDGLSVRDAVNHFLEAKEKRMESGELSPRTFADYKEVCLRVASVFGKSTKVAGLRPKDFQDLREQFARTHGPQRLVKDITYTRSLFRYADDTLGVRVRFGEGFQKPSKANLRKHRQKQPPRMFTAEEIRAIVAKASVQMQAMVLLGVNAALGNTDIAMLTFAVLDLRTGWLTYPRPKTGVERRAALWPETIKALMAAIAERPNPRNEAHSDRVFITLFGNSWEDTTTNSPISKEFAKLLDELGIRRKGVNFYALRHVFQTIGQRARDKDAVALAMGHAETNGDMSVIYSEERPDDARLRAVSDYVRAWLYPRSNRGRRK